MSAFKAAPISWDAGEVVEPDACAAPGLEDFPSPPRTVGGAVAGRPHPEDPARAQATDNTEVRRIRNGLRTADSRGIGGEDRAGRRERIPHHPRVAGAIRRRPTTGLGS